MVMAVHRSGADLPAMGPSCRPARATPGHQLYLQCMGSTHCISLAHYLTCITDPCSLITCLYYLKSPQTSDTLLVETLVTSSVAWNPSSSLVRSLYLHDLHHLHHFTMTLTALSAWDEASSGQCQCQPALSLMIGALQWGCGDAHIIIHSDAVISETFIW